MNNKGQALVEFVLILPIFLIILFTIIDFGVIFNAKSSLESTSSDIVEFYKQGKTTEEIKKIYPDLNFEIEDYGDYNKLIVKKEINLITPGLNRVLSDPYPIVAERIMPYA